MRPESEILSLLVSTAENDPRIRAAYLEGSRVDPGAKKDLLRDYDVEFIVRETASFRSDREWIKRFGDILFMQYPEDGPEGDPERCYGWLMVFTDGNRIDLHVCTAEVGMPGRDGFIALCDKDGILPGKGRLPDHSVQPPDEEQYRSVCNEFWWCLGNVAKGIRRGETPYVLEMLGQCVRPALLRMLEWYVQFHCGSVNSGKFGKHIARYLPEDLYNRYLSTYCFSDGASLLSSVDAMTDLFSEVSDDVAAGFRFARNESESAGSLSYYRRVVSLPDGEGIF